jgi:Uncharacterised nucleotidyltransferase
MTLDEGQRPALLNAFARELFGLRTAAAAEPALPPLQVADAEKIAPQVIELELRRGKLSPGARAAAERIESKRRVLEDELATITVALRGAAVPFAAMRGFAIQAHYPPGLLRQFNDLDVVVPDSASLARAIETLREHGYYVARPMTARRSDPSAWVGAALNRDREDLDHPLYLDLVTEGPGLSLFRHYRFPGRTWDRLESVRVRDVDAPVLGATDGLVAFAVELRERAFVTVRDALDAVLLAAAADREEAAASIASLGLGREIEGVARLAAAAGLAESALLEDLATPAATDGARSARERRYRVFSSVAGRLEDRSMRIGRLVARMSAPALYRRGYPVFLLPDRAPLAGAASSGQPGLFAGARLRARPFVDAAEFEAAFPEVAAR